MPLPHTSEPKASNTQTLPLRLLERTLEFLEKVVYVAYHFLAFFASSIAIVITLSFPYLHYRGYRRKRETEVRSSELHYQQMIEALDKLWDTYSYILLPMSSLPFPMVSSSGLPLCSVASFLAVLTLTVGAVSVATSTIYKLKFKALHNRRILDEWLRASQQPWRKVPNKSFWILLSLPTYVFSLFAALFIATAVLSVLERPVDGAAESSMEIRGCPTKRLHAFKNVLFATLAAAVIHFIFVITKIYSMVASAEDTVAAAV